MLYHLEGCKVTLKAKNQGVTSELLIKCIRRALNDLLGDSGARAVFYHLNLNVRRVNLDAFAEGLRQIFGIGAHMLERHIVSTLSYELGVKPPRGDVEFKDSLRKVLRKGLRKKKKRK